MNVLLTDVSTPPSALPATTEATSDSSSGEFHNMMQKNLQSNDGKNLQVIDSKELIASQGLVETDFDAPLNHTLQPESWVEFLATSEVEITAESDPVAGLGLNNIPLETPVVAKAGLPTIEMTNDKKPIGESLPLDGKALPMLAEKAAPVELALQPEAQKILSSHSSNYLGSVVMSEENLKPALQARHTGLDTEKSQIEPIRPDALKMSANLTKGPATSTNDFLDLMPAKTLESAPVPQSAIESMTNRFHAAMNTVNSMSSVATSAPSLTQLSPGVELASSFDRLVMTNPNSSVEWSSGIGERVSLMLNQKQNAATIRLDPPMLGKMDIQIQVRDDVTNVTINTQHAQTRDLIDNASFRLREYLQDAGYQNVNVDVSQQNDQQKHESMVATESELKDSQDGRQSGDSDNISVTAHVSGADSLVDYFA